MPRASAGTLLRHLRELVASGRDARGDRELLESFRTRRDETAFAVLLQRHGPLVWRVCRRALEHEQDAEDAFQAAFIVLAKKAASIRNTETVSGWLHGVACRIAMNAKRSRLRRQHHPMHAKPEGSTRLLTQPGSPTVDEAALREMQALLDEEVARLPRKYREPFILCCLEGRSRSETAAELGWKLGTVSSPIAQARRLLQERLTRRGVTLSAALTAGVLWEQPVSAALVQPTLQAAMHIATGQEVGDVVAPRSEERRVGKEDRYRLLR